MTSDIPTNFGFPALIRILIPGMICSMLSTYFILPIVPAHFAENILLLSLTNKIILWITFGLVFGMAIISYDFYIYRLFMGTGIFPKFILRELRYCLINDFDELANRYDQYLAEKRNPATTKEKKERLRDDIVEMSHKLRENPFNTEKEMLYPSAPTRLGNIIIEYESYSEIQYGMSFNVFWSRIWQVMPKDNRDDLDLRAARADFNVYLLLIWIIFLPFMGLSAHNLIGVGFIVFFTLPWLIIAKLIYLGAIRAHENYGGYVKASFDTCRIDLAQKLDIPISLCPNWDQKTLWQEYGQFLEDYNDPNQDHFRNIKKISQERCFKR